MLVAVGGRGLELFGEEISPPDLILNPAEHFVFLAFGRVELVSFSFPDFSFSCVARTQVFKQI